MDRTLILFYSTMWGAPLDLKGLILPEGCEISTDRDTLEEADAVVFHLPQLGRYPPLQKREGQIWVAWSMECEKYYPIEPQTESSYTFDLTMTYKRQSDVLIPYYYPELREKFQKPVRKKSKRKLAAMFESSGHNQSKRLEYTRELMQHLEIHSYGKRFKNRNLPDDRGRETKMNVISEYKFTLAFENAIAPDYVTEKFFDPLVAGSVPIYLGAPNIKEFAPGEHCYIDTSDFTSPKHLAKFIKNLNKEADAYAAYHAWREMPLRPEFQSMLEEVAVHPFIRLCRKVQAIREGLR